MHDLDRTQLESADEAFEADEFAFEERELFGESDGESPFNEMEEMELATELMSISSEEELDQFLGKLLKRAWRGVKHVASKVARPLGGVLRNVAKKALPFVGGALGSLIPIPGVGTAVGSALGGALSKALEMELEGTEGEDQEFEMARRFVRVAGAAARQAATAPSSANPRAVAVKAVAHAFRRQAGGGEPPADDTGVPSPHRCDQCRSGYGRRRSGNWIRRGRKIVLLGI